MADCSKCVHIDVCGTLVFFGKKCNAECYQYKDGSDLVEVVHGHNLKDHNSAFECSVCGWEDWDTLTADTSKYNYCPNCGAKMDGERNAVD